MHETVGMRIERIAAEKGIPETGAKLARRFGVSFETLRKWKRALAAPNRARQAVVAGVLGVAPEVFMHGTNGPSAGDPLLPDESRLLRAYRMLLREDKAELLRGAEKRAREVEELQMRLQSEQADQALRKPGKPRALAA